MTKSVTLTKINAGNYETKDGRFSVVNYMGVWTVVENEPVEYTDFMTLAEAREFIAEQVA